MDLSKQQELIEHKAKLQGSFLYFCQYFYKALSNRDFILSNPVGRESHFITVSRELTKCKNLDIQRLIINIPPGHGKSTLLCMWIAWTMSMHPDSRYMYVSYSAKVAKKQTEMIREIMSLNEYKEIFGIKIRNDSKAKEAFKTNFGGAVMAFGSDGSITGFDAGLPGLNRFTGALVIDDAHKPDEVVSKIMRENVIENFKRTCGERIRDSDNVPIIFLGQRLNQEDLPGWLIQGGDGYQWNLVILKSLDQHDNALYPEVFSKESLIIKRKHNPYVFAGQHQQDPVPEGGGLYEKECFVILDYAPTDYLVTFITGDTAETENDWNCPTVFSFWGLYVIPGTDGQLGLHWIHCIQEWVEPRDLKPLFDGFLLTCRRHPKPPSRAGIEKKSTGTYLLSLLKDTRGIEIMDINRDKKSKTQRCIDSQTFAYQKLISFTKDDPHVDMCIEHMTNITANSSHARSDIADTYTDACKMAFIDKSLHYVDKNETKNKIAEVINQDFAYNRGLINQSHMYNQTMQYSHLRR